MAILVKVDNNGTKYFSGRVTCDRCGGAGGADMWADTGYVCYKCGGSGFVEGTWKEYTPEHEAKLEKQRQRRAEKRAREFEAKQAEYEAEQARIKAEREAEEARIKAEKAISKHVGNIGDKINMDVIYIGSAWFEVPSFNGFGMDTKFVHTFADENGNKFVWKTSNSVGRWVGDADEQYWETFQEGETVHLRGTIKAHDEYKDEKQTILTRCKLS